jgi:hypothetical protein
MKTIWKFVIGFSSTLEIPKGAEFRFLCVQDTAVGSDLCLWFEVDPSQPKEPRKFHVVGTGHHVRGNKYLGSFQNTPFVWHVYEDTEGKMI